MRFLPLMLLVAGCGLILETDPTADGAGIGADSGVGDANPDAHDGADACVPRGPEECNGLDDDCNGEVDEDCSCAAYVHPAGTGSGATEETATPSISDAILRAAGLGGGLVCVAALDDSGCFGVYDESVVMEDGVDVVGGFRPLASGWVDDPDCNTIITSDGPEAVHFPEELTEETMLSRFVVQGPSGIGDGVGVSFLGGGTLRDVTVKAGDSIVTTAVWVADTGGEPVVIDGGNLEGATGMMTGDPVAISAALIVENRQVDVRNVDWIFGGHAMDETMAIFADRAEDLNITNVGVIEAGNARISHGLRFLETNDFFVTGPMTDIHGAEGWEQSTAVFISGGNGTIENLASIRGGSGSDQVHGMGITNGADVFIQEIDEIVGRTSGSGAFGAAGASHGLLCDGAGDTSTNCIIERSSVAGLGVMAEGAGIAIGYYDTAQGTVHHNVIQSTLGDRQGGFGVNLQSTLRVTVDANWFTELDDPMQPNVAVNVRDSEASIFNNFVRIANQAQGLVVTYSEADSRYAIDVHSNTIIGEPAAGPTFMDTSALVDLRGPTGVRLNTGIIFRHNILLCRPGVENVPGLRQGPLVAEFFNSNLLYGCGQSVINDGVAYGSFAALRTWLIGRGFMGNILEDPMVDPTGHLMTGSPAIDEGRAEGAPPFDIDDGTRPTGMRPDIGCDEYGTP